MLSPAQMRHAYLEDQRLAHAVSHSNISDWYSKAEGSQRMHHMQVIGLNKARVQLHVGSLMPSVMDDVALYRLHMRAVLPKVLNGEPQPLLREPSSVKTVANKSQQEY